MSTPEQQGKVLAALDWTMWRTVPEIQLITKFDRDTIRGTLHTLKVKHMATENMVGKQWAWRKVPIR